MWPRSPSGWQSRAPSFAEGRAAPVLTSTDVGVGAERRARGGAVGVLQGGPRQCYLGFGAEGVKEGPGVLWLV